MLLLRTGSIGHNIDGQVLSEAIVVLLWLRMSLAFPGLLLVRGRNKSEQ